MRAAKYLLIYLCLCSTGLYAQKSQIGIYLNPNIASTKLHGNYKPQYFALKEGPRTGFDAGFFYKYSVTERLKVELRVGYSLKGFAFLELTDANNNYLLNPNTTRKVSYQYLEIPIIINYSIIKKSWFEFYPAVGFSNNFLLNYPFDIFYGKNNYRKYNPGIQLGAGFSFHPGKSLVINIEPTEKIFLSSVTVNKITSSLSRKLYSFGLNIGLGLKF